VDLTTNYLGLSLRSPLVPSASPLSEKIASALRQLFRRRVSARIAELRTFLWHRK